MVKEELQDIILYQQSSAKAPTCTVFFPAHGVSGSEVQLGCWVGAGKSQHIVSIVCGNIINRRMLFPLCKGLYIGQYSTIFYGGVQTFPVFSTRPGILPSLTSINTFHFAYRRRRPIPKMDLFNISILDTLCFAVESLGCPEFSMTVPFSSFLCIKAGNKKVRPSLRLGNFKLL